MHAASTQHAGSQDIPQPCGEQLGPVGKFVMGGGNGAGAAQLGCGGAPAATCAWEDMGWGMGPWICTWGRAGWGQGHSGFGCSWGGQQWHWALLLPSLEPAQCSPGPSLPMSCAQTCGHAPRWGHLLKIENPCHLGSDQWSISDTGRGECSRGMHQTGFHYSLPTK